MPDRSIKKYMHPLVKEDDRLFTGLCIVHHSWRLQWNSLGEYLADFEPVEDCPCDMCNGQYEHPTLRKMLQASVCSIYSLRPTATPDLLSQHWPNMNCVLGDCYICGWNNISPPCPHCPLPDDSLEYEEYTRTDLPTKNGNTYRKTELVVVTNKVSNLLINMQEGLNEFKRHHFFDIWIEKMMSALTKDPPVGWLVVRWDFPQKFQLERKGEVSEDFYSHETILVLVAAMSWKTVDGKVENHAHFFVTQGYMKKNPAYIFHCMAIVMKWAARRDGVTKVVHSSDRCRAEFSNGTFLLMLAKHFDEHQLDAEHVYSMEHEGKGPNNALGGVIRTLLKTAQKAGLVLRTPFDVCQALQSRTQGRPIKGKYSVFTQYVFHCVNPGDVDLVPSGKTVPGITKSYSWRCCRDKDRIMRRRLPCFCSKCVAGDWDACKNAQVSGPWDSCKVREKPSNASQDSECASQASDLLDMSDDSCFA